MACNPAREEKAFPSHSRSASSPAFRADIGKTLSTFVRSSNSSSAFSGREKSFAEHEIIVSKTDLRGVITYVNDVFIRVSGFSENQLLGAPHNIIRHPDMPRCVFKLLWDTVQAGHEIFAYVLNRSKDGTGYWVFAHVTPSYDLQGNHVGYHSNRRVPYPDALAAVKNVYATLLDEEKQHSGHRAAAEAGHALLLEMLASQQTDYAKFVFGLSRYTRLETSIA